MTWFEDFCAKADAMVESVNPHREDLPTEDTVKIVKKILMCAKNLDIQPSAIAASHAGSIAICFTNGVLYADMEVEREGNILAVRSRSDGEPDVWAVSHLQDDINRALRAIELFLRDKKE